MALALGRRRHALQVLQGILEVVVDERLRLGADFELVVDCRDGLHLGGGIGDGLADVLRQHGLLGGICLGLGREQQEGFLSDTMSPPTRLPKVAASPYTSSRSSRS